MPMIEPNDPNAVPAAPAAPAEAETTNEAGLPDEVLQIPALSAIMAGKPAAVSAPIKEFAERPEAQAIVKYKDPLMRAGMGTYTSMSGELGVLYNRLYLPGEKLQEADKAGKLLEIAPPFDQVNQSVSAAGPGQHPAAMHDGNVPTGLAVHTPEAAMQPQSGAGIKPLPAKAQTKITTARVNNLAPGGPTSGSQPGAGRLLNSILKQPI